MAAADSPLPRTGHSGGPIGHPILALLFVAGQRPTWTDLRRWSLAPDHPARGEYPNRLEIVGSGQRFELSGLRPGPAASAPPAVHFYGFSGDPQLATCEAVTLVPAVRAGRGDGLVPMVRAQVALASQLAALPGLVGVLWGPAATAMAPGHFTRLITAWLDGGAFPGLGLTGLAVSPGAALSTGLALFTGHEIAVSGCASPAANARLALRAIHLLAEHGASGYDAIVKLGDGEMTCTFSADRQTLLIGRAMD